MARYARQIIYPGIGESGQRALLAAHVTLIGVGATGSVLANHLARAGVGHLRLVDRDFVELNNLQRQLVYDEDDVAQVLPKAVADRPASCAGSTARSRSKMWSPMSTPPTLPV